tara:strand:+ start:1111 stop:1512 length:402 start_codon:yes stop_codon:yes gene_type:complete
MEKDKRILEFKINIVELATTLAHKRLTEILPDEIIIEDEHMTKYTEEGQIRFDELYNEYWDEIADAMIYPCYTGEKFYTIFQKTTDKLYGLHEYDIIERVWDSQSEEMYRIDPMRKMFRTRGEAEEYVKEITE